MPTSAAKRPRIATTGVAIDSDKQHRDAREAYAQQHESLSASSSDLPHVLQHNLNTSGTYCQEDCNH